MPQNNRFWRDVTTIGSAIGGAWILSEILKGLAKPVYRCPYCGCIISANTKICPRCGARVKW